MAEPDKSVAKIREEARRRLSELEPLLEEAERLRTVLAVLDPEAGVPADDKALDLGELRPARPQRGHVRADKDWIVAIVAASPGITAAEIARRTGMKRSVVASTISRLKRTGELVPWGEGASVPDSAGQPADDEPAQDEAAELNGAGEHGRARRSRARQSAPRS